MPEGIFTTINDYLLSYTFKMSVLVIAVKQYLDPIGRSPRIGHRYGLSINLTR